ncbi:hypothetical protein V8C86DRAFT_2548167 [Haematococcus lacustris]
MSGQGGAHSTITTRASVDAHAASIIEKLRKDVAWPPQALETLTKLLIHYATSYGNNPVKWTELARCVINNLPSVTSQAFNVLKELDEAKEALQEKRGQLDEQIRAHWILQSCLEQAIGDAAEVQPKFVQAQQQVKRLQDELRRREARCADLEDELNGMLASDEEMSLWVRCKELEEEIEALRRELEELKSRSRPQVFTPPPVRVVAEGDNVAGPSGIQQVDQARSAFRPTRLFPEEPTGNAQARPPLLVEQEVAMHRHRSSISNQTGPQPAARPPGGVAGPSRADQTRAQPSTQPPGGAAGPSHADQASPSSITPDRPAGHTIPASPNPPPSIDEYGRLSKAELEAKIAKLTQRGCVSVFRNAGILTKYPNRDPGLKLVLDQLFEVAGWLLPDTSLPGSIAGLVKLLRNMGKLAAGGHDVIGSVELVQAAYKKKPEELAPAIQLVPWEDTHLHIQGLTDLLIRLGVDKVREANDRNISFPQPYLRQEANRLTGAAPVAHAI